MAAESFSMDVSDGSLVKSASWVGIDNLGTGLSTTGNVSKDVESNSIYELDASTDSYVFVIKDHLEDGANSETGNAGIKVDNDLAVLLSNFGADDQVYIDDAFNNNVNDPSLEFFTSGRGDENNELFIGLDQLASVGGDPRLYIELADGVTSTDEFGVADSKLASVNQALDLEDDNSIVISA